MMTAFRCLQVKGGPSPGSLPHERSHIRTWLSIAHQFSACRSGGVHIRIYDCICPEACWSIREPLTARAGPYMYLLAADKSSMKTYVFTPPPEKGILDP